MKHPKSIQIKLQSNYNFGCLVRIQAGNKYYYQKVYKRHNQFYYKLTLDKLNNIRKDIK